MNFLATVDTQNSPPFFDLVFAQELDDLFNPAIRFLFAQATERFPRQLLRFYNYYDEIYTFIRTIVEYSYLLEWDASFSEHFYGLKRSTVSVWKSLIQLVAFPYLYEKLEAKYGDRKEFEIFKKVSSGINLIFKLAFLSRRSPYFSLSCLIFGTRYDRLGMNEMRDRINTQRSVRAANLALISLATLQNNPSKFLAAVLSTAASSISYLKDALPACMFLYKFGDWWFDSDAYKESKMKPIPPPPEIFKVFTYLI